MNKLFAMILVTSSLAAAASPQKVNTIRQIDFENYSYPWSDPEPPEDANEPWHWLTMQ
jgi:hypothetical protein